jgi:hypothetical protein
MTPADLDLLFQWLLDKHQSLTEYVRPYGVSHPCWSD